MDKIESNIKYFLFPAAFFSISTLGIIFWGNKPLLISALYVIAILVNSFFNYMDQKLCGFRLHEIWSCCSIFSITIIALLMAAFSLKRFLVLCAIFSTVITSFLFFYFCKLYFVYDATHKDKLLLVKLQNALCFKGIYSAWIVCRECDTLLSKHTLCTPPYKYQKHIHYMFAEQLIPDVKTLHNFIKNDIDLFIFRNIYAASLEYNPWSEEEHAENKRMLYICLSYFRFRKIISESEFVDAIKMLDLEEVEIYHETR